MDLDDLEPRKTKPAPKPLDDLSIDALEDYIEDLKAEIIRVEADIKAKKAARAGAELFFKK